MNKTQRYVEPPSRAPALSRRHAYGSQAITNDLMLSLSEPIRKAEIERVAPLEPINTPTRRGPRVNILPDVSAVLTNLKPRFGEVPCNILLLAHFNL